MIGDGVSFVVLQHDIGILWKGYKWLGGGAFVVMCTTQYRNTKWKLIEGLKFMNDTKQCTVQPRFIFKQSKLFSLSRYSALSVSQVDVRDAVNLNKFSLWALFMYQS